MREFDRPDPRLNTVTGEVYQITDNEFKVRVAGDIRTVPKSIFSDVKQGDKLLMQNGTVVGKLKPTPVGKVFQV